MSEENTGSVNSGTPSTAAIGVQSLVDAANNGIQQPSAPANNTINPSVAALQQPLAAVNKDAWYSKIENESLRGYAENRNWKDIGAVVESYQNLEKFMGADKAGRGVVIPASEEDQKGWNDFYQRLGRPLTPSEYKLKVPEGYGTEFADKTATWMHEAGLTSKQANAITDKYNEYLVQTMQANEAKFQQDQEAEHKALMSEWGREADKNIELARRGVVASGVDEKTLAGMVKAVGTKKVHELFYKIGSSYLEDQVVGLGRNPLGSSSPEGARAEIESLKKDADFRNKLYAGDADAKRRWEQLKVVANMGGK